MQVMIISDEPALIVGFESALVSAGFEISAAPDVVVIDTTTLNYDAMSSLRDRFPKATMLLWTRSITSEFAFQASNLGVRGLIDKRLPIAEQVAIVRRAGSGELTWGQATIEGLLDRHNRRCQVTRREGELIALVSQGLKNKEIAYQLHISEGTVKVYLSRLFPKLGVKDRYELAVYALRSLGVEPARGLPSHALTHMLVTAVPAAA